MRTITAISPTPICFRSSSTRRSSTSAAPRCPSCPTPSASATRGSASRPYNASVLTADVDIAGWFDALLESGAEPKAAANWTASELFGALNRLNLTHRREPGQPRAGRRIARPGRRRHACRARSPSRCSRSCSKPAGRRRDRRGARAQADQRHRRDRRHRRPGDRRQRRQGRAVQGRQGGPVRLLRRPGDEGDGRQGQPEDGQRAACGPSWADAADRPCDRCAAGVSRRGRTAVPPVPPAPPPPPLVIVIDVDQLTGALFDRYRTSFTGGLGRLAKGTVFRNGVDAAEGEAFRLDSQAALARQPACRPSAARLRPLPSMSSSTSAGRGVGAHSRRMPRGHLFPRASRLANSAVARLVASPEAGFEPPAACQPAAGAGRQFARAAGDYAAFTRLAGAGRRHARPRGVADRRAPPRPRPGAGCRFHRPCRHRQRRRARTCVQLHSLDRDLGAFFDVLDRPASIMRWR